MSLLPQPALRHTLRSAAPGGVRHLHASRPRADHYRTLDVPRTASLRDIKAQFYRVRAERYTDACCSADTAFVRSCRRSGTRT